MINEVCEECKFLRTHGSLGRYTYHCGLRRGKEVSLQDSCIDWRDRDAGEDPGSDSRVGEAYSDYYRQIYPAWALLPHGWEVPPRNRDR